jgi:tetratricopeptide (TPR) repeat protein
MVSLDDPSPARSGGIDDESYQESTTTTPLVPRDPHVSDGVDVTPRTSAPLEERRAGSCSRGRGRAVLAGVSLAYALGARLPGQTSSGNSAAAPTTTNAASRALKQRIETLQKQVNAKPDDFDLRLELSRAYEENGDLDNALKQSDAAITIDANRPEGHANAARLLYLASEQVPSKDTQAQLVAQALAGFNQAIAVDPTTRRAYFFRAVVSARRRAELARSQVDLQNYLVKAPAGQWASQRDCSPRSRRRSKHRRLPPCPDDDRPLPGRRRSRR